jgi:hypothetical protein
MSILTERAPRLFGARNYGDLVTIKVPGRLRPIKASYIGSGRFSSVYRIRSQEVIIYNFFGDRSKCILEQSYRDYKNPHLPKVKYLGDMKLRGPMLPEDLKMKVFRANYYTPMTDFVFRDLPDETKGLVRALKKAHRQADNSLRGHIINDMKCGDFNRALVDKAKVPNVMKKALTHLAYECEAWGDHYIFDDFRRANMALDARGRIVFIDPMFDVNMLHEYNMRMSEMFSNQRSEP